MKQWRNKVHNVLNIRAIMNDAKCFETVRGLRWPLGVRCVDCDADTVVKHGRDETQPERQRYRCRSCDRCFDDLTGTIFEGHHQPLAVWILCLYFMGLNLSNRQISRELDLNTSDVQKLQPQLAQGLGVGSRGGRPPEGADGERSMVELGLRDHPGR